MLFSKANRIVIEADGDAYYATDDNMASPSRYIEMVKVQRDMTILGYEVYRFGGQEFVGAEDQVIVMLHKLFKSIFRKRGIDIK